MKVDIGEKQSLAWFRLAEYVGKKEKERALGMFRLLTHSLHDKAFIKKLKAEIFASFQDDQCLPYYAQAAHLYRHNGDSIEALAIYEQLMKVDPERIDYVERVIDFFEKHGSQEKVTEYQKILCTALLQKNSIDQAISLFETIQVSLNEDEKWSLEKDIVMQAIKSNYSQQKIIERYLKRVLEGFSYYSQELELQLFISSLEALDTFWHKSAVKWLEQE